MNKLLEKYKESLKSAWGYNDYNDWPIKFNSIMHLFLEEFYESFEQEIKICDDQQINDKTIAASFGNPARIYRMINGIIYGMKRKHIDLNVQRNIVCKLLDITSCLKYGSIFNENGKNIIYSPTELNSCLSRISLHKADTEEAQIIQKVCGILWAYTEAIFFRAHDITKEFHGLYTDKDFKGNLLVREYLNLAPTELWPDVKLLPYQKIKIYCLYNSELCLSIDAYNHLFLQEGNYIEDLYGYYITGDGEELTLEQLFLLSKGMFKTISDIQSWVYKNTWVEHTKKYADIYWYRKKPLSDLCCCSNKVPDAVYKKIENGSIDERRTSNLTERQIDLLISTII